MDLVLHKRDGLQKRITGFCRATSVGDACHHLRRRLDRWTLVTLPGYRVRRAVNVLAVLQRMSSPRVQASYLRALCDGWCTRRRFQCKDGCLFGCGHGEDSLSHFANCSVVSRLYCIGVNVPGFRGSDALDSFFCMNTSDEEEIVVRCKGLYALYRLYNGLRYHAFLPTEYQDAFIRYYREALL
jgi:hypothetical protein